MKTAAVDIETTGTKPDDQITVIGVDIPMGSRLFLNTGGREYAEATGKELDDEFPGVVSVNACDSEHSMLRTFQEFALQRFGRANQDDIDEFKFAAYNGETWNGGFDLPFIRTRCREHDVEWPLQGPYIDVMTVVGDHFNVSGKGLETTYGELVGEGLNERDPFADSGAAVQSWRDGKFEPLLQHNLVDCRQRSTPAFVADCQRTLIDVFDEARDPEAVCAELARWISRLEAKAVDVVSLEITKRASKQLEEYTQSTQTTAALQRSTDTGQVSLAGRDISYVVVDDSKSGRERVRLPSEEYSSYDVGFYQDQLISAAESVLSPVSWCREEIRHTLSDQRNQSLRSYRTDPAT